MKHIAAAATRAGYTVDQMAVVLGQGAYDVDDFMDTYICGATTGNCQAAPVWGLASDIVKYTSYFHFQQQTRGADAHGNDYGITEANYRQGSTSSKSQYADFEKMPFQPIDNLGQFWYSKFQASPTFQTLGFVLHTTDLLQPHHTWTTSALNHVGWETWVNDNYYSRGLNNDAAITAALADFTPVSTATIEIRPLLTQAGRYSYTNGGAVLNSTADGDRNVVAQKVIPHAIAMTVRVLDHAANRF